MDKKFKKNFLIIFFIILFLLIIFSVFFSLININNNNIFNGISINNIDISGMSKEEANAKISNLIQNKKDKNLNIKIDSEENVTTTFDYLEVNYNLKNCINEAFNIGRSGNIFKNNFEILNLLFNKKNLNLNIEINTDNLNSLVDELSSNLDNKVIQSSYYIENNNLIITKGQSGNTINIEDFSNNLYNILNNLTSTENFIEAKTMFVKPEPINIDKIYADIYKEVKNAYYEENQFKVYPETIGISFDLANAKSLIEKDQTEYVIPLEYSYPEITINDLNINIFKDKLSFFTTYYDTSNKDRAKNLELSAEKINGKILSPGEEFSYNSIVGERTISAGYKEAKIYSNGKVVDGIGGGICQLSSTLYNSAFFANLDITERYNHQFLTSYVPEGRDATVVYGVKDFKFKNNRTFPIKIEAKVSSGVVSCAIYGIKEDLEYDVSFDVEKVSVTDAPIKYEYDSSLKSTDKIIKQRGSNGMTVNVYKILKLNGSIVSKTFISQDIYKSLEKIIITNSENN